MNKKDVIELLMQKVVELGSYKAVAKEMHVTEAYISMSLSGKRSPGPALLKYLGIEKKVDYVRKEE